MSSGTMLLDKYLIAAREKECHLCRIIFPKKLQLCNNKSVLMLIGSLRQKDIIEV